MYVLHIAKVGGCSSVYDVSMAVGRANVFTSELCYLDRFDPEKNINSTMVMLRAPRGHVLSQYNHCATGGGEGGWKNLMAGTFDLVPKTFGEWVMNYRELQIQNASNGIIEIHDDPYGCYRPIDRQSHILTCTQPDIYPAEVSIDAALHNMYEAEHVGILEAYQESMCLLHARKQGALPAWCNCNDAMQWGQADLSHVSHNDDGAAITLMESIPEETLQVVDALTANDRMLYNAALQRFVQEIHEVEKQYGTKIMCAEPLPV